MTWPIKQLGEVADTALGKMLDKGKPKGLPLVPYLRNISVQWGRVDTEHLTTMELSDSERDRFGVNPGDLLVCEGGEIGRCAIWHGRTEYIAFQKALHRIRPGSLLDTRFLRHLLEYYSSNGTLASMSTGTTIAHLPQQQLRSLPIPLPPLLEQHRIVEVLEDHLSRLDAAERLTARSMRQLFGMRDRVLLQLLGDTVHRRLPALKVLRHKPANGRSVPTADVGFPVLRLTALRGAEVDLRERKTGDWTAGDAAKHLVQHGDILLSRGNGSRHLVGRAGIVTQFPDPVAFPDTMIRLSPDTTQIIPRYLVAVWNAADARAQIEHSARTTAGIYKINQAIVGKIELPVPDLASQEQIVQAMSDFEVRSSRLAEDLAGAQSQATALRRSLLRAAFNGELVDQDPNDEPADITLDRNRNQPKRTSKRTSSRVSART